MAITWLETDIVWGSNPAFRRSVGYEETGRTASSVTYKIHLKLKVNGSSSSFYGYSINWQVDGGSTMKIKDSSPRWNGGEGYRSFSTTITKSVGAGGGSTSFKVVIKGGHGSSGSPNLSKSYTAKVSTFNTNPTWSSSARITARENNSSGRVISNEIDGTENQIKIAENVGAIYLSWDSANDSENNISKYELYAQISEGSWSMIYSGSARNYTHNIGSGASTQGRSYDYYVVAVDSYGAKSSSLHFRQFQKNQLTGARLSISNGFWYGDEYTTFTWSGASNTNGNSSFTYSVNSTGVPIYNKEKIKTSGQKILFLKKGTSTEPYILMEDALRVVDSNKEGSFDVTLTTTNAYGSTATSSHKIYIDLKTPPTPPNKVTIGGHVSTSLGNYLIPSKANAKISWSGAVDPLGGTLTYDVYYKVGAEGQEVKIEAGTNTSISVKFPTPTTASEVSVRVVAKASYGLSASSSTVKETIHYYNPPTVSLDNYNRTITSMAIDIYSKINTSIPNAKFSKQSYTGNGTSSNFTGAKYTATITGLTNSSAFIFTATVNDNTGLSTDQSATYKVTPATPKLSVREKGVGVNCIPSGDYDLEVEGTANIKGDILVNGKPIKTDVEIDWNNLPTIKATKVMLKKDANGYAEFGLDSSTNDVYLSNVNNNWFRLKPDKTLSYAGYKVYTAYDKPTAGEIGALPLSGGTMSGALVSWTPNAPYKAGVVVMTQGDNNNVGDGNTHLGYREQDGTYSHYFRGKGKVYITNSAGLQVSYKIKGLLGMELAHSLYIGEYEDQFRSVTMKRRANNQNYEARYGISWNGIKQASSDSTKNVYGACIECHDTSTAVRRYLFGNNGFYPLNDNASYCGASSHRWQALYCSTGTVYSSSKGEKEEIQELTNPRLKAGIDNPLVDTVITGIKNLPLYKYKYKTLSNDHDYVGFLGQELEEMSPDFFNLIGSSYKREDGKHQYDIREASLNGVLLLGLQSALLEIDKLKQELQELKN